MIAVWMLYCVGIAVVFVVVGHALERGLHLAGRPSRWAWIIALAGSFVLPAAAWLRPEAFSSFAAPIPAPAVSPSSLSPATTSTAIAEPSAPSFSLSDLDAPLRWGWGLASLGLLLTLAGAATRLVAMRRRWRRASFDGRAVLVSRNVGPAVVGLLSPHVVLPEWALTLPVADRELMMAHEEQHLRARDPALLATAFVALLVAPWNPALWWQWKRLRLAVEMDCDARVLAQGRSAAAYGELLLQVGRRRMPLPLGAAAFGEPASLLESRLRRMLNGRPRWRWVGAAFAVLIAAGATIVACETPRPADAETVNTAATSMPTVPSPWLDSATLERLRPMMTSVPRARSLIDSAVAERSRPWVRASVQKFFPTLLSERTGPRMDLFLILDRQQRVFQAGLVGRAHGEIGIAELRTAYSDFEPRRDEWGVIDPRGLRGLLRDNVRVIWIQREHPAAMQLAEDRDRIRALARQYQPEVFRYGSQMAVALVMDGQDRVLAHAAKTGEARNADGSYYNGEDCRQVLERLLPAYRATKWALSGCLFDAEYPNVIVYWGFPEDRYTRTR